MANSQAKGSTVKHPVAPTLRYAFLKALDIMGEREGKTLPQIMDALIKENGLLAVMDRVAKFAERTSDVNMNLEAGDSLVGILTSLPSPRPDIPVESEPESVRH